MVKLNIGTKFQFKRLRETNKTMAKKNTPFEPYKGKDDYIFISYAHKDSAKVFDVIKLLHEEKYRIWYDEGIEVGAQWPQVVASRLKESAVVLIFLSNNALSSQNCQREIHYAVSQKKEMIVVNLEDCVLSPDLEMQLSVVKKINCTETESLKETLKENLSDSLIGDGITGYERTDVGKRSKKNIWLYISMAAIAVSLLLAVYIFAALNGFLGDKGITTKTVEAEETEVSVTQFKDNMSMQLLLNTLDSKYVHICGNCIVSDPKAVKYEKDEWTVAGEKVSKGDVNSLTLIKKKDIEQLSLINEKLKDLSGAEEMNSLKYLDISDNPITDLSGIENLENLETLYILNIPEKTDISVLTKLNNLKRVYVSVEMTGKIAPLVENGVDVTVTNNH